MNEHPTDREWLLNPDKWPKWPICPLKRVQSYDSPNTALVFGDPVRTDGIWTVWFVPGGNIWHIEDDTIKKGSWEPIDKILAEGWEVD